MVTGFGLVTLDVLMPLAHPIHIHEKNVVDERIFQLGGVVPTALVVLSRLGVPCELHTVIANDHFGNIIFEILRREQVSSSSIQIVKSGITGVADVIVDRSSGERTIFYTRGIFPSFNPQRFSVTFSTPCALCIVDGHNAPASLRYLEAARRDGIKTIVDLGNPKKGTDELVAKADIIVVPQAYWRNQWSDVHPEQIAEKVLSKGPSLVIITMGENGCLIGEKGEYQRYPAFDVRPIDTNGAGDIFLGAFSYGLVHQWDTSHSVRFASAAAALSCEKIGKEKKIPSSVGEVNEFLKMARER